MNCSFTCTDKCWTGEFKKFWNYPLKKVLILLLQIPKKLLSKTVKLVQNSLFDSCIYVLWSSIGFVSYFSALKYRKDRVSQYKNSELEMCFALQWGRGRLCHFLEPKAWNSFKIKVTVLKLSIMYNSAGNSKKKIFGKWWFWAVATVYF